MCARGLSLEISPALLVFGGFTHMRCDNLLKYIYTRIFTNTMSNLINMHIYNIIIKYPIVIVSLILFVVVAVIYDKTNERMNRSYSLPSIVIILHSSIIVGI